MRLLAADIGGTKSNLRLFERTRGGARALREASLANADFPDAEALLRAFLRGTGKAPAAACLAIAGTVSAGRAGMPNLGWTMDAAALEASLGIGRVALINDLEATACGIPGLPPGAFETLNAAVADEGPIAVIAAGTGLGEAVAVRVAGSWLALPGEGGHADFAPGDELELGLTRHLWARHGHASWERVVSGPGLVEIYRYLAETAGQESARFAGEPDPAAAIAAAGLSGRDATASRALDLFARAYGAEAGNLALRCLATGGVYVAGGIAPKLIGLLRGPVFLDAFFAKGRYAGWMRRIPLRVVLEPKAALEGAAQGALATAGRPLPAVR
ncbi:MAG: glucokinase [Rhodocyclaceae bacterium]